MTDKELLTSLKPGALVRHDADPDKWMSLAEAHPMLVLEVARVKDLTMIRFKLLADWPAAWVLRSDGVQRAYPISWLKQLCNADANPKTWT